METPVFGSFLLFTISASSAGRGKWGEMGRKEDGDGGRKGRYTPMMIPKGSKASNGTPISFAEENRKHTEME